MTVDFGGLDLKSAAMIGGFFVAGFVAVWIFLTLRQGESRPQKPSEDDRG
jgi:hypothetical protein